MVVLCHRVSFAFGYSGESRQLVSFGAMLSSFHLGVLAAAGEKARVAVEQGAAVASRYIEQAGDKLEQRYSATDNPRQLDPKTKARCTTTALLHLLSGVALEAFLQAILCDNVLTLIELQGLCQLNSVSSESYGLDKHMCMCARSAT